MNDAQEDVYESEDLPEADRNNFAHDEVNDPEHIELVHIDIDSAKKRFEGRTLNCRDVDFSDSIAKKRQSAYGSSAYVLEVVGKGFEEPETPEQKFNRLTYEINELASQLQEKSIEPSGLLNEKSVQQLFDEVKGTCSKQQSSDGTSDPTLRSKTDSATPLASHALDSAFVPLEERLRRLELLIGPIDCTKQPLIDALEDLKFRAEALNSSYVEGLETRLHQVLAKLEQVDEKREKSVDGAVEANVNELLALISKWDAVCSTLPSNVKKVQALQRLHEQAQHFADRLSRLTGVRNQVEKTILRQEKTMRELQVKAKKDVDTILEQITALESRLTALNV